MPTVTISRNRGAYAKMRALKIIVEGEHVASIRSGDSISVDVPSHEFEMYGKMDWAKTNVLTVHHARAGDHFHFEAWFTLNAFRNFGIPTMPVRLEQLHSSREGRV